MFIPVPIHKIIDIADFDKDDFYANIFFLSFDFLVELIYTNVIQNSGKNSAKFGLILVQVNLFH